MNSRPRGGSTTISSSSTSWTRRVSRRKAGIAEATKLSPSPTPTTSGHSLRAPTSRSGLVGVHRDEGVVAAQLGVGGAHGLDEVAVVVRGDQVGDDLGVGLGAELAPPASRPLAQLDVQFSTMPLSTMWTRPERVVVRVGVASVTRPWVAQRVWPMPRRPAPARDTPFVARDRLAQLRRGCRRRGPTRSRRPRAARCRPSRSRGTRASRGPRAGSRGRAARRIPTIPHIEDSTGYRPTRLSRRRARSPALARPARARRPRPGGSVTASHSASSGASTITRTSGSVPDGRTSTRPRPSSALDSRSTASQTAVGVLAARRGRRPAR